MRFSNDFDAKNNANFTTVMKKVIFALLVIFTAPHLYAQSVQDSILLLNGKVFYGEFQGITIEEYDSVLTYKTTDKKGATKLEQLETYRIFSYTDKGAETVLYYPDEFKGDFLSVNETREVTIGSYDARETFTPHFPFWSGFALGLGASVLDTYLTKKEATDSSLVQPKEPGFFRKSPSIFPFLVPAVVSVSWSFPSFKVKKKNMIHKEYFNNANYYRGYHRIAKQKRMLGSLFGSLAGIATGMIVYYSVN